METETRRAHWCSSESRTNDEENNTLLLADYKETTTVSGRTRRYTTPLCLNITLISSSLCIFLFAVLYVARHTTTTLRECDQRLSSYCRQFHALTWKVLKNANKHDQIATVWDHVGYKDVQMAAALFTENEFKGPPNSQRDEAWESIVESTLSLPPTQTAGPD
jgi:hypothetical protein